MSFGAVIRFLAWHSECPLDTEEVEWRVQIATSFAALPGYKKLELSGQHGHVGLFAWMPDVNGVFPLLGSVEGGLVGASFPPYGISRLIDIGNGDVTASHIHALIDRFDLDPAAIAQITPPTSLFRLTKEGTLSLVNDFRGLSEIYMACSRDGVTVWSNVLSFASLFTLEPAEEDKDSAMLRAYFSYYPRSHSPLKGITRLPGATHVVARDAPEAPRITEQNILLELLSEAAPLPFSDAEAECVFLSEFERHLNEARGFLGGNIAMGLTGGRDSRLLLTGLIAMGREHRVPYYTIAAMSQDVDLARQLTKLLHMSGHPIDWREIPATAADYERNNDPAVLALFPTLAEHGPDNDLLRRFLWIFQQANGQVMPGAYYRTPRVHEVTAFDKYSIGGFSGEILRAPKYTAHAIAAGLDTQINKTLKRRYGFGRKRDLGPVKPPRHRPLTKSALQAAADCWSGYLQEARASGLSDFRVFDYFAIAGQQSRRIGLGRQLGRVAPLANPKIMQQAFKLPDIERAGNAFHMKLIRRLCPTVADLPYSFQIPVPSEEIRRDNARFPPIWDEEQGVRGFRVVLRRTELWADTYDESLIKDIYLNGNPLGINEYQKDRIAAQLSWRAATSLYAELLRTHLRSSFRR